MTRLADIGDRLRGAALLSMLAVRPSYRRMFDHLMTVEDAQVKARAVGMDVQVVEDIVRQVRSESYGRVDGTLGWIDQTFAERFDAAYRAFISGDDAA